MCPDGYVYDLTINDNHNYFVDDILVHNCLGSYPKPNKKAKQLKELLSNHPNCGIIYTTGTPTPESYSQLYHQIAISPNHKWSEYKNFYHWAKEYVNVKQKYVAHGNAVNDYSDAKKDKVLADIEHLRISYTQDQAGFENTIKEQVYKVEMSSITKKLIEQLRADKVIQGKEHVILADTPVKEMQKVHQLASGTIKFECGVRKVLDKSKVYFIKRKFANKKIAIMYVFVAEGDLLKESFENWTDNPEEFNKSEDKVFIGQIRSSREGVNLSSADVLIMYNIEFSALSYLQGRDRMTSKERIKENRVVWLFSDCGLEEKIYKVVKNKENYTTSHYCNKKTNKQTELF